MPWEYFQAFLMNIEDLEIYEGALEYIELEDVFPKFRNDMTKGFYSVLSDIKGIELKNQYLDKVYANFCRLFRNCCR